MFDADIATVAALVAERARTDMCLALLGGDALTAGELARAAGVSPSSASPHLARLLDGGLLALERQGRHRYYRLSGRLVAEMLETLLALAPARKVTSLRDDHRRNALRHARSCYDHLAGMVAVGILRAMVDQGTVVDDEHGMTLTADGPRFFDGLGLDVEKLRRTRRPLLRPCLDWTERRHHIAGTLGAALFGHLSDVGAMVRMPASRAVTITPKGAEYLAATFGFDVTEHAA